MKRFALSVLCALVLAGCETTGARPPPPPVGASTQEIEPGRWRVTFRGVSRASEAEVRDRALLQAAELALAQGADWFRITDRYGEMAPSTSPRLSFGVGVGSYGRGGGVDLGASRSTGGRGSYVAILEMMLGRGPRPDSPDAYDARAVAQNLGRALR